MPRIPLHDHLDNNSGGRLAYGAVGVVQTSVSGSSGGAGASGGELPLNQLPAHASTHQSGGTDTIKLDDLATPDDNTDLDATTGHHGLLPKLGGGTTNFLRADGSWAAPPGGGGGAVATDTIWDAKGDLAVGTASDAAARLAVGSNGQVLTADSTQATGMKWATPSGGSASPVPFLQQASLHGTYGDDFDASSLDAKWTLRNIDAGLVRTAAADGSELFVDISAGSADRELYQSGFTNKDEFDLVLALSNMAWGVTTPQVPVLLLNSSGTGVGAQYSSQNTRIELVAITTYAASSVLMSASTVAAGLLAAGQRYWIRLVKRGLLYFATISLDGINWLPSTTGSSQSFTPDRIGFGRALISTDPHQLAVARFNVENYLNVGNNLVRTPTSGTATYTASSEFSASFAASKAADGTLTDGWAANGTGDNPLYWQVAWSVGQTLNRVRILSRPGTDHFGSGHIEFSDGSKVPLRQPVKSGLLWTFLDFPTKTGITTMKIVSDAGKSGNPGLAEVEAYYAS